MSITKKFCEVERGLVVGNVSIDGDTGNITSTGLLSVNTIETTSGVLIHASGSMDIPGEVTVDDLTTLHSLHVLNSSTLDGTLNVAENVHFQKDLTIDGDQLITTSTSFNLLNKNVDTINFGHTASNISIGKIGDHWVTTNSNLEVVRNLTVGSQFEIAEGKFQFDGTYGDQGATRLQGILEVSQQATFGGNVNVDASLYVDFNAEITGYLKVTNNFNVNDKFTVAYATGNTVIYGTQNTKGATTIDSTLNVEGAVIINDALSVSDAADVGALDVASTLNVEGSTVINDTLHVTGAVDLDSTLNVDGTLNVEGSTTIDDTLNVTGAVDLDSTLNVDGNSTLHGTLEVLNTIVGTTITDNKGEVRLVPQNEQASTYTLVASDHGKHILASNTVTVPGNVFSAGQTVVIINWTGGNITLSQGANMSMYQVGTSNTGNRTLAQRALVTLFFINANNCIVSGSGLT